MDGIPNALKEAMATGMPVVATHHSGIPELVEDRVSGFLVPEGNVDALVQRLTQLLRDPRAWQPIGRAARERVLNQFDVQPVTTSLIELYDSVLSS